MKTTFFSIRLPLTPVVCAVLLLLLMSWTSPQPRSVLIFAKNTTNQSAATVAMRQLKTQLQPEPLQVDTTTNDTYLTEDSLKKYSAVIFLNTSADVLPTAQQADVERFVQAGGGLGLVNTGGFTTYQWAWYQDMLAALTAAGGLRRPFDGGRVTSLTAAANAAATLEAIWYVADGPALNYSQVRSLRVPEENRFTATVLDSYMEEPLEMEVLPDGRVLFIERRGAVKLYDPAAKATRVINKLPVHTTGNIEDGLLGLELDPQFAKNQFVYLYYSPVGTASVQNLSRFVFTGDSLLTASEKLVMQVPVQRETCCHSAGNVFFGPDGHLYLSTGDNTSSKESDGFSPIDERPGRAPFDAQKSSGNTHDLRGKILRIHVEADGSYSIPDGNLFPKDGSAGRPEIYVMGARNPYRIWVDKRGFLYWGDVGPDGGTTNERGPKSHDEWNQARQAGNYGWPYFGGDNKPYADFDFVTNKSGPFFNPGRPVNESPNNTGLKILPPAQKAMIWYPYDQSAEFPMLGTGSRSAMAGPFYYPTDYRASAVKLPAYYANKQFIYEWARSWMKLLTYSESGDLRQIESFMPGSVISKPIDMKFGPDGAMYVLAYGVNYFSRNPDSQLLRIEYTEGNRRPVANIKTPKLVGAAPLMATLSAAESFDYDRGDKLTYLWDSGHGQKSTAVSPAFTYRKPGVYRPKLTVTDAAGQQTTTELVLKVGNEQPAVHIAIRGNRSFYFDKKPLEYTVTVTDREDGSLGKGIQPRQVTFAVDYLAEGKDLALLASNEKAPDAGGRAVSAAQLRGKSLLTTSDCKACHAMNTTSVGPSLQAISKRYHPQGEASVAGLAKKIIEGGNGNWGKNMMSAHPQHTEQEAAQMVRYILSLSDPVPKAIPLQGSYSLKNHEGRGEAGSYVISASYTDRGNPTTGQLTGRQLLVLRNPRLQAEAADLSRGFDRQQEDGSSQSWMGEGKDGAYIAFKNTDLTGVSALEINTATVADRGGRIEVRTGSPSGTLLGAASVAGTGNERTWQVKSVTLKAVTGLQTLYLVIRNEKVTDKPLLLLDWVLLVPK